MFSAGANQPNQLSRIFMIMGAIVLAYGIYQWNEIEHLSEAGIQARVESVYQQELYRMEQAQLERLSKRKDEIEAMSAEEQAAILMQASQPIKLTPEQEAKHKKAIRRDITESIAYKKKKASALMFGGGALLFLMFSPIFSTWVTQKLMGKDGAL